MLCECGCGRKTAIPTVTDRSQGRIKGRPMRFVTGHNARVYKPGGWNGHTPDWFREQDRRRA